MIGWQVFKAMLPWFIIEFEVFLLILKAVDYYK